MKFVTIIAIFLGEWSFKMNNSELHRKELFFGIKKGKKMKKELNAVLNFSILDCKTEL